ncbi:hypothetical protein NQZ68_018683 [Dissostichus eleginoides]|nr:hypothetical protein NQZ68_018683 [Dissostichus eleginoides]
MHITLVSKKSPFALFAVRLSLTSQPPPSSRSVTLPTLGQAVSNNCEHLGSLQALHLSPWGSSPGTGGPTQLPLPLESCLEQADYRRSPRRDMRPGILRTFGVHRKYSRGVPAVNISDHGSTEAVEAAVDDSPCVWAIVKPREQVS